MPILPSELGSRKSFCHTGYARAIVYYNLTELPPLPHSSRRRHHTTGAIRIRLVLTLRLLFWRWLTTQVACSTSRQRVPSRSMAQQRINNLRATAMIAILRRAWLPRLTRW